jgi:hypothetical protein
MGQMTRFTGQLRLCMLLHTEMHPKDNGVWLVFSESANPDDPKTLQDFPLLRLIDLLGGKISHWRLIPADSSTFESEALHACDLLLTRDARFGRVPQSRQTRSVRPRRS